jgi:hypothetical protein
MDTPYARITEIREAVTSAEANECLGSGFVLIKAVEKRETDALGRQASSIVYVLGKLKANGNGHAATIPPAGPTPAAKVSGPSSSTRTGPRWPSWSPPRSSWKGWGTGKTWSSGATSTASGGSS